MYNLFIVYRSDISVVEPTYIQYHHQLYTYVSNLGATKNRLISSYMPTTQYLDTTPIWIGIYRYISSHIGGTERIAIPNYVSLGAHCSMYSCFRSGNQFADQDSIIYSSPYF